MKPRWIIIPAALLALMAGYAVFRLGVRAGESMFRDVGTALSEASERGRVIESGGQQSIRLNERQTLLVTATSGVAVIRFTDFGDKDGTSSYAWRFQPADRSPESSGSGQVFERYTSIGTRRNAFQVTDAGSQLVIEAGPIRVKWSYASDDAGWIYYNPDKQSLNLLDEDEWERLDLKQMLAPDDEAESE